MTNVQESTHVQVQSHALEPGDLVLIKNSKYQEVWGNVVELTYFRRTGEMAYGIIAYSDVNVRDKEQVFYRLPRQILNMAHFKEQVFENFNSEQLAKLSEKLATFDLVNHVVQIKTKQQKRGNT